MNIIWILLLTISSILLLKTPNAILKTFSCGANSAIMLALNLLSMFMVWMGLLQILQDSGLSKKLANILKPLIKLIFKNIDDKSIELIALNLSANILGLGNASTPLSLQAMKSLDNGQPTPSYSQTMLFILNCCSLQLIPTTIISLKISNGSSTPTKIILPIIIVSTISCLFSIFLTRIIFGDKTK
jgi:spore maturation protein A